ncbi:hypothetical protein JRO89_XS03G0200800 [Xanthoceras sorbifolium]|uniref:Reverse transcriptase zinc-binding domain-containing protein n=1 Tax=Xanthoceras sorbifolium TaxID=99658 RepID=A0ABQ8IAR3_9ROSI|nr:hypothetical protein JRO89_XS03G0200800 [Xanthoceras sorbifolium]
MRADFVQADNQPFGPWLRASSSGVSRPSRENTGRAAPVTPTGNMAGSGERRLVVATAARSSEVGLQVHAAVDGDASLTETADLKKNSDLMAPAMASSAEGERAASLGAAKGVLLRVETAPSGMGKSVATVSLGAGAASNVARSSPLAAQVHGHLAHADTSQVLGHPTHEGAAHVHSHLALEGAAHVHGPLVLESAAHVQPCLALPDGHACDACAHPCTALACALPVHVGAGHVQPCVSLLNGRDSAAHVLPCMAQVRGDEMTEEGYAVSFTFSAQADASNTGLSPLHAAAMEVDRKHFKWKRVARMGMVGNGDGVQLSGLGKRAELEPLEGEGSDRVKRSRGSKNEESSLLKLAGPASPIDCSAVGSILGSYSEASGQKINFDKSALCVSKQVALGVSSALALLLGDRWLPRPSSFKVIASCSLAGDSMVASLKSASGAWNTDLVRSSFAPIDADCILSLPTSVRSCPDKLMWHHTKDGKYSVKSGYWLASSLAQDGTSSSSSLAGSSWWKFLWGLNIPAKVRMFVWRACRNLLPTRSLLAARRVPVGAGCPLCGADVDSVLHSLWLCRTLVESKAAVPFLAGLRLPAVVVVWA